MRKASFLITVLWLALLNGSAIADVTGANFLRQEHNARVVGMGGAFAGLADDGDAVYWNPAGLSQISHATLSFTHCDGFMDTHQEYLNVVCPLGRYGTIGVDVLYSTAGTFTLFDDFGFEVEQLDNYDVVLDGAWALALRESFSLGLGMKAFHSRLAESTGQGIALDIGVLVRSQEVPGFSIGCCLQNFGTGIRYISDLDLLPMNLKLGPAYKLYIGSAHLLTLSAETNYFFYEQRHSLNSGLEYGFRACYFLRCGYRPNRYYDKFSFGAGLRMRNLGLDYALLPFGSLGMAHRVTLSLRP